MMQDAGVGEIVINSIDRDGTKEGFDFDLVDKLIPLIRVPLTILGGAGSYNDIKKVAKRYGIIGISAGSLFIYQGRYDAVLINFLSREDIEDIENITKNVYQIK